MSEHSPKRMIDGDEDVPDLLRAALRGARRDAPTPAAHAAIGGAIARAIGDLPPPAGGGSSGGGAGNAGGATTTTSVGGAISAKTIALGGLAIVAVVGAVVVGLGSSTPSREGDAPRAIASVRNAPTNVPAPALPSSEPVPSAAAAIDVNALPSAREAATTSLPRLTPSSASSSDSPESVPETTLLAEAQDAIASSPATALARCDAQARAYPKGSFVQR